MLSAPPTRVGAPDKPLAALSCDLDNRWAYLKTRGNPLWKSFPCYLSILVPRLLEFLKERDHRITVFLVGQDTTVERNREALRSIADAGHEIGNHSFHHDPWLHLYSDSQIERELADAEEAIERATGQRPVGFRGPGYSLSLATLKALLKRGYAYDATTLPNLLNPLMRSYFLMMSDLDPEEHRRRQALFGSFADGFRPVKPYHWKVEGRTLLEVPVTTMPLLKVPFHVSYIIYLSRFSRALALRYFETALAICRATNTEPSLLLHSLDFVSSEDVDDLSFFPGMQLTLERKLEMVSDILALLQKHFTIVPLGEYARVHAARPAIRSVTPKFSHARSVTRCQ